MPLSCLSTVLSGQPPQHQWLGIPRSGEEWVCVLGPAWLVAPALVPSVAAPGCWLLWTPGWLQSVGDSLKASPGQPGTEPLWSFHGFLGSGPMLSMLEVCIWG